ncbi:MAG TPA: hypothetical protein ENI61_01320 [Ignavibacteria bacterium]|nr:hypothetical protein [Ignavibacteria bacterium]
MNKQLLEIYSDYLMSSYSYTTATGLSILSEGKISHDKITRFLSSKDFMSAELWKLTIKELAREDGVIIVDDTIEGKAKYS